VTVPLRRGCCGGETASEVGEIDGKEKTAGEMKKATVRRHGHVVVLSPDAQSETTSHIVRICSSYSQYVRDTACVI